MRPFVYFLCISAHFMPIRMHAEFEPEHLGRPLAYQHALQENLKKIQNGANLPVQFDIELDSLFPSAWSALRSQQRSRCGPACKRRFDPVAAHVALIRQDERRRHRIDCYAVFFVVPADGGYHYTISSGGMPRPRRIWNASSTPLCAVILQKIL